MRFRLAILLLFSFSGISQADDRPGRPAEGENRFALDLYARLRNQPGNLCVGPASLWSALAMTQAGARGQTALEMMRAAHLEMPPPRLQAGRGYQFHVANRLWVQEGTRLLPEFLDVASKQFGAGAVAINFAQGELARQRINAWVEEQTHGKVADLVPSGALDAFTRLLLTSATYFQGAWGRAFDRKATRNGTFSISKEKTIDVPFMSQKQKVNFGAGDGTKLLELPYVANDLAMLVLLPERLDGLADLENKLSADRLNRWLSGLRQGEIQVSLPRFKATSVFDLAEVLKSLGMTRAFTSGEADFSGITGHRDLFLSGVVHKAFVEVNEEGTEAAAATEIEAKSDELPAFRADHPFVFLIRDRRNGLIFFLGRVMNPKG